MGELESALSGIEKEIEAAEKTAIELVKALKRAKRASVFGRIAELERALSVSAEKGELAGTAATQLAAKWVFDAKRYVAERYLPELGETARASDLHVVERDGRLFAFPLALKLERAEMAVRIGKKLERGIRPSTLVRQLAAIQSRPLRFSEQRFLDLLFGIYERMVRLEWRKVELGGLGPVIPLADIHALLTLLPGSDYPVEEFGRDLLLLDRKPGLRTREGHRHTLAGSALARERVQPIKVYDEDGREHMYLGLAFTKEG